MAYGGGLCNIREVFFGGGGGVNVREKGLFNIRLMYSTFGLGFGVWGLGFGVWGLGFRVWGLGFRV